MWCGVMWSGSLKGTNSSCTSIARMVEEPRTGHHFLKEGRNGWSLTQLDWRELQVQ